MDISKLTIIELKALAYELIVQIQIGQQNLQVVQTRITELMEKEQNKEKE